MPYFKSVLGVALAAVIALASIPLLRPVTAGNPNPATVAEAATIAQPICSQGSAATMRNSPYFRLAQATKNELRPLGQLPEANGQATDVKADDDPPLWDNLGTLHYRITTRQPLAQQYFDQGLRLTYAFNHAEAIRAYRMAQKIDPQCAMCYWGEALALGPNINLAMDPAANAPALAALKRAQLLKKNTDRREQDLIAALEKRYSDAPDADRAALDAAYADAMCKLAKRYPKDQDIAVLYAESLMNLSPWDYWASAGTRPKGTTAELVATLERVLEANPDHPGAIHYYIHTVEASVDPKRAEPYAERLGKLVPGAGHLVHMPAHIYYRIGRYRDSLATNIQAVAVDEAYIASQKPQGIYPLGYYPHNVHFVMVSAQMAGDGITAVQAANKLAAIVSDESARQFAIAQPVKAAPYFTHAQFSEPAAILALPAPGAGLPYVQALWHYARGVALAARGDLPEATAQFRQAVALEDQLSYMEPPYWYYPVRQSLGAMQLLGGDLDGAERTFRDSLMKTPSNGWALYGLSEVYRKRGDSARAAAVKEQFERSWAGQRQPLLSQL